MEFDLHKPGKPQTVPYDTVLEALLLKIQTEFDGGYDVARSLKNLARVDLNAERPQRLVSVLADPANRAIEQDGLNIDYAEAIKLHHLRVEALRKGLHSAYSLIFDKYCTKSMRDELRKAADFETRIIDNPIRL